MDWMSLARALHILAVIAWMAGLLMLPRLYAYQTGALPGGELDLKMREGARRLRTFILTPASIAAWVLGVAQLWLGNWALLGQGWMLAKLALVTALTGLHHYYASEGNRLARGEKRRSEKFWRMINEAPFVLAIAIVLLAVLKPF